MKPRQQVALCRGLLRQALMAPPEQVIIDLDTSARRDRHAPAGTASTAPALLVVSRTTTPDAAVPTSTHAPPLPPL